MKVNLKINGEIVTTEIDPEEKLINTLRSLNYKSVKFFIEF